MHLKVYLETKHVKISILLTKTAARNGVALNYRSVRGLYFLAVVFVKSIIIYWRRGTCAIHVAVAMEIEHVLRYLIVYWCRVTWG